MLTIDTPPEKKRKIERNKVSNAKRDAKDRNPHFSLTVEVKKGDVPAWKVCAVDSIVPNHFLALIGDHLPLKTQIFWRNFSTLLSWLRLQR